MSDQSDRSIRAPSLPNVDRAVQSTPALSDLSEKDKPWDKHKANADKVADYYAGSEFAVHSQNINFCSQLLEFALTPDADQRAYKLKLRSARFCRVRHCPVCQWRRSLRWKAKAHQAIPKVMEDYPKYRWLFVTLTLKNCQIDQLRKTLKWVNESFKRFSKLKVFPAQGWIKSVEVTRGKDGLAHPHLHILMLVKPSYFHHDYLSQAKWVDLWQQCLRVDYKPILDVQAIKKDLAPHFIIPEILKYQCKESDLVADQEWFLELTRQLKNTRAVAVGGVLRGYMKELEVEPEDLIGKDDQPDQLDEGLLWFGWKGLERKYRLVDHH
jgi:plasmid rolling circle replication initiator protein Rep